MKKLCLAIFFGLTAMLGASAAEPDFARIIRQAAPASVWIRTDNGKIAGAGFFIRREGWLATAFTVLEKAENCSILTADGKTLPARLAGSDPATGIAVLQVRGESFPVLQFASSPAELSPAQWVTALGGPHPGGMTSAVGQVLRVDPAGYIRTNAVINLCNAGGPLLNERGEVAGLNLPQADGAGNCPTALRGALVQKITGELIQHGFVPRPYLGILLDENMQIRAVAKHSPAADSLDPGDLLLKVNGQKLTSPQELLMILEKTGAEAEIFLEIRRGSRELSGSLILRQAPRNWYAVFPRPPAISGKAL